MNGLSRVKKFQVMSLSLWVSLVGPVIAHAGQVCKNDLITPSTPTNDFILLDSNGLVVHKKTGLMWMRCSLGQDWDANTKSCHHFPENYSWSDALEKVEGYEFAGYSDWRLPNKNELVSLIEVSCVDPTINSEVFPSTPIAYYWTSTQFAAFLNQAWSVHFNNGYVNYELKAGKLHVRLVRGGR